MDGLGLAAFGMVRKAGAAEREAGGDPMITVGFAADGRGEGDALRPRPQPSVIAKQAKVAVVTSKTRGMGSSCAACFTYTPDAEPCLNLVG